MAEYEILELGIDTRPAEEGGKRYTRTIDEVTGANERADESTSKLEERFRSLARTTASGAKSAAGWVLHHSVLLGTVALLSRSLSAVTSGALALFLGGVGKVSGALENATSYLALFAAKGLRALGTALSGTSGALGSLAAGLMTGATWMERWGSLTLGLSVGMVALGGAVAVVAGKIGSLAAAAGNKFIPEWNRVLTLVKGTPAELRALRGDLESLAASMGVDQAEAAHQYYEVLSALPEAIENPTAGLKVLEYALKASASGFSTTADAISAITGILYNYNLTADHAGEVADALFKAQDLGSITFGEVAASISQAAPLVSALGGSYQDLLAITALVSRGQTTTSEAMTEVSSAMSALITNTAASAQASKELGIQFDAASVQAKGLAGFLLDIIDKTDGHPEVLSRFFGRKEAITLLVQLAQRTGELRQVVEEQGRSAGAADRIYQQMNEDLQRQKDILAGPYKKALTDIGVVLDGWAIKALKAYNAQVKANEELMRVKSIGELMQPDITRQTAANPLALPAVVAAPPTPKPPEPEATTLDYATQKIQQFGQALQATAMQQLRATGNVEAYDRAMKAADVAVNNLVAGEVKRLSAAGVAQAQVNTLASLYRDTYGDARKAAEEYRKEMERLTQAAREYQAVVTAPAARALPFGRDRGQGRDRFTGEFKAPLPNASLITVAPHTPVIQPEHLSLLGKVDAALRSSVTDAIGGFGALGDALGALGGPISAAIRGVSDISRGLDAYHSAQSGKGGILGTIGKVAGIAGVVGGAISLGTSIISGIGGLFHKDDKLAKERNDILKSNGATLAGLREDVKNAMTGNGLAKAGPFAARLAALLAPGGSGINALNGTDVGNALNGSPNAQLSALADTYGLSFVQLAAIAKQTGITLMDSAGHAIPEAFKQLVEAIGYTVKSITTFGTSMDDLKLKQDAYERLFNVAQTPGQKANDALDLLSQMAPALAQKMGLSGLDLTSAGGRAAALGGLQDIYKLIASGNLSADLLGSFTDKTQLLQSVLNVKDAMDALAGAVKPLTTDIPKAINLALYERTFGTGVEQGGDPYTSGTGGSTGSGGGSTSRPPSGPTDTGGGFVVHGGITIVSSGKETPEELLQKLERAAKERAARGGKTVLPATVTT